MIWAIAGGAGLLVVVVVLVLVLKKKPATPADFAKAVGLSYQNGVMRGLREGYTITVQTQSRRSGKGTRTVFQFKFPHRLNLGLSIRGLMGQKRSLRCLSTGDEAFDAEVAVEAQQKAQVLEYLTPERKQCIRVLVTEDPRCWINDDVINWTRDGSIDNIDDFKEVFDNLMVAAIELNPATTRESEKAEGD